MADDIDDLLDEVETKYCSNQKRQDVATFKNKQSSVVRKSRYVICSCRQIITFLRQCIVGL